MKIEFEMRRPVARWLLSRGLIPVCEVGSLSNCDFAGCRFAEKPARLIELVAVELKLRDVAGVIRQCERHRRKNVTEVWAAMLPHMAIKHADRFRAIGVGVLAVGVSGVWVVALPVRTEGCDLWRWFPAMRRRRREYVERMKHPLMKSSRTVAAAEKAALLGRA